MIYVLTSRDEEGEVKNLWRFFCVFVFWFVLLLSMIRMLARSMGTEEGMVSVCLLGLVSFFVRGALGMSGWG